MPDIQPAGGEVRTWLGYAGAFLGSMLTYHGWRRARRVDAEERLADLERRQRDVNRVYEELLTRMQRLEERADREDLEREDLARELRKLGREIHMRLSEVLIELRQAVRPESMPPRTPDAPPSR